MVYRSRMTPKVASVSLHRVKRNGYLSGLAQSVVDNYF